MCLSGRKGFTANEVNMLKCSMGSNPIVSAIELAKVHSFPCSVTAAPYTLDITV